MAKFKKLNYTQTPNEIFDDLMPTLTGAQFKVIMLISRHTLGYHRDCHAMSIENIAKKTGLSRQGVLDSIEVLEKQEFIIKEERRSADNLYFLPSLYYLNIEDGGVVNSVDYPSSSELTTPSQLIGLPLVNSVDYPIRNKYKGKYNGKEKDSLLALDSQKNEIQNQGTSLTEDSTLEPDSPPIPVAPSRVERLDKDVEFTPIRPATAKHVFSRMKNNRGRTIKASSWARSKITEAIGKLSSDYSEEIVLDAVEAFLAEDFWSDYNDPALAFPKFLASYEPTAAPVQRPAAYGGLDIGLTASGLIAPLMAKSDIPVYAQRWNAAMPEAYRMKYPPKKNLLDKLFDAERDPEFIEGFDRILERCRKMNEIGVHEVPSFNWLFETPRKPGSDINWLRVLSGLLSWAEKPKVDQQARPKQLSDVYEEKLAKALEKEKLNGSNGSESSQSRSSDRETVGITVGDANDG